MEKHSPNWIRLVELVAIAAVGLSETAGTSYLELVRDPSHLNFSIGLLAILAVMTIFEPRTKRFVLLTGVEFFLVALASAFGVGRLFDLLYMTVGAKAGLRCDSPRAIALSIATGLLMFLIGKELHYWLTQPAIFSLSPTQHILHVLIFGRLINQSLQISVSVLCTYAWARERDVRLKREAANQEITEASAKLERTRMSRDIHDSVGHLMTAVCMQLDFALAAQSKAPQKTAGALVNVSDLLSLLRQELSKFSQQNAAFDFSREVAALVASYRRRTPFLLECDVDAIPVPEDLGRDLFNTIKESLHNIEKYAQANQAWLSIKRNDGTVRIEVRDDGRGFNPSLVSADRYGLRGVRERLALYGGEVDITSAPGEGTVVAMKVDVAF